MKNILVPIDFHPSDRLLTDYALQLAKAFGSNVWLMHIAAPDPDFVGFEVGPQYVRNQRAAELRKEHRLLQTLAAEFRENGVSAEGFLIQGATIGMIMEEAVRLNVDLIIAGHHEHTFLYKAFTESVSAKIIKKSRIPLLLVPVS